MSLRTVEHQRVSDALQQARRRVERHPDPRVCGRLTRLVGMALEARGAKADVGSRCKVECADGSYADAEVVGFAADRLFLMPITRARGFAPDARVIPLHGGGMVAVGESLLGRIVDGAGKALDGKGPVVADAWYPLEGPVKNPLSRAAISAPLDVGVRAINALLSVGRGQRMGLFAGSGVGKSVLLGMMSRYTQADVIVLALIGERGREVKAFIDNNLGSDGLARSVVIATPADYTALMRLHGAMRASAIAEYFRDQGKQVLLLMDSLTRYAQAQREISLAVGEPPATKGYTPSVFARLPRLVERAGTGSNGGTITAFYTVLAEGDDPNDPIVDAARAILDGHVILSRSMAETGIYPAVDVERSISRIMVDIAGPQHLQHARRFRSLYSRYRQNEDLISVGAYQKGSDAAIDEAIAFYPRLQRFINQGIDESVSFEQGCAELEKVLGEPVRSKA